MPKSLWVVHFRDKQPFPDLPPDAIRPLKVVGCLIIGLLDVSFRFLTVSGVFILPAGSGPGGSTRSFGSIPEAQRGWTVPLWRLSGGGNLGGEKKLFLRFFLCRRLGSFYFILPSALTTFPVITLCLFEFK